ncbi:cupin domain-containing protein, partial [Paraburkholderia sp.]|uniref:cupin domain-containing protein n=1 Tax=Paraburkholderia sp. TaxID=1926495 RepID=UPI002D355430
MSSRYDYRIDTEVKFGFLKLIDVNLIREQVRDDWTNQTLCRVNDCVVRLGVVQGEFHWHRHDNEDEFFYVVDGRLFIDVENGPTVELLP